MAANPSSRCGFIALVGVPNAGKSTLMNNLVGSKISIVSPKVQTTRNRVLGIALEGEAQLIFVDTPGIFANPKSRLERAMVAAAWSGAGDADIVALLIDAQRGIDPDSRRIVENLAPADKNRPAGAAYLVLNKIDAVRRDALLVLTAELNRIGAFEQTFMVSALTSDGVADLRRALGAALPAGPWVYPEDQLADLPLRLMAAEFTREQLFLQLYQELPYSLNVETEGWTDLSDGSVRIEQVVTVMRDSQKPIVLGKGGQRIKSVRLRAQDELARALDRPVHLFVHVRVREGWIDDPAHYRDMGLEFNS